MIANRTLIGHKINGVIIEYAKFAEVPIREAFDKLYKSQLYSYISRGVSDMHCRSDGYLAEELMLELNEAATPQSK